MSRWRGAAPSVEAPPPPPPGAHITSLETDPDDARLSRAERKVRTAAALSARAAARPLLKQAELLDYVVRINMGVARSLARRYLNRGVDEDDLQQVAYLALIRAARDFDPTRDDDFLSYAVPTIRGELKKYFRDLGWVVRPPRRVQETQAQVLAAEGELVQSFGRTPTAEEVADHLHTKVRDVHEAMTADGCFTPTSLDRLVGQQDGGGGVTIGDLLAELESDEPASAARMELGPAVRGLSERDREILFLRFFKGLTQQEIAEEIGVTQMQVSRLLTRILRDLRRELS